MHFITARVSLCISKTETGVQQRKFGVQEAALRQQSLGSSSGAMASDDDDDANARVLSLHSDEILQEPGDYLCSITKNMER